MSKGTCSVILFKLSEFLVLFKEFLVKYIFITISFNQKFLSKAASSEKSQSESYVPNHNGGRTNTVP